jgi:hypothetical protein
MAAAREDGGVEREPGSGRPTMPIARRLFLHFRCVDPIYAQSVLDVFLALNFVQFLNLVFTDMSLCGFFPQQQVGHADRSIPDELSEYALTGSWRRGG